MYKLIAPIMFCLCFAGASAAQIPDLSDKSNQTPEQTAQKREQEASFANMNAEAEKIGAQKMAVDAVEKKEQLKDAVRSGDTDAMRNAMNDYEKAEHAAEGAAAHASASEAYARDAQKAADDARQQANDAAAQSNGSKSSSSTPPL
jgi:hypothetical protein